MTDWRNHIFTGVAALVLAGTSLHAQVPSQPVAPPPPKPAPAFYRNLVVLDPAHGGRDSGATITNTTEEKDVTLAIAQLLRPALVSQGFTVVGTRDSDMADMLTADQRAGTANHVRPLACIVIHAAPVGSGVRIFTSELPPQTPSASRALPWDKAQAPAVPMSLRLANEVGLALDAAHLPALLLKASVPPVDSLLCPAIAVEIGPLKSSGSPTPATSTGYQQRVANAIAAGLASYRTHNAPAPMTTSPGSRTGGTQ
ncbi:MAG TPA: N-acetylmuramoyl-L-alanine amidase [Edaphobacter sp.]